MTATLDVDVSKPGPVIPDTFFGLMTEEINYSYDGGLYAELIQNRTFQDPGPRGAGGTPIHWSVVGPGKVTVDDAGPVNPALPLSLRLELTGAEAGVANDGFWGIPVRPDTTYAVTFYAKASDGFAPPITASIRTDAGDAIVAKAQTEQVTGAWRKYTLTLKTGRDAPATAKARFVLSASGTGSVSFSYVSLFPPTYRGAPNGLRPDLMELLAGLKPKFVRFPGGNYVEGNRFSDRYNWKQMIGPPDQRPGHMGCWGYRSSDGMGVPEFLLWCKQLDAEPVLGVFAGYVLNGDHFKAGTPEMALYTREALEQIEYIAGPADSEWGRRRAAEGFPEPFKLRYVEIGNEDWFDRSGSYDGRFAQMAKAIRERYPHLQIIASAPVKSFKPDLYDDHFYRSARQFLQMTSHYDPRPAGAPQLTFHAGSWSGRQPDGVKTFVGEWATQEGSPTPTLNAALADAAFLLGMERNADAVTMQAYAPLLANVNPPDPAKGYPKGWQWHTNLIGYDALRSFGSPSYHAQAMLAQNKGDVVLTTKLDVSPPGTVARQGAIGVGAWRTLSEYTDITVSAPAGQQLFAADLSKDASAWSVTGGDWKIQDGAIRPAAGDRESWAIIGDPTWTDYTIRLRARKLAGREGFLVLWHAVDGDNYHWWNVGGWDNSLARAEVSDGGDRHSYGPRAPFKVEVGRWYDVRVEVTGRRMRGFIDDKLVTDSACDRAPAAPAVVATATLDKATQTVIVKVVNAGRFPVDAAVNVRGAGRLDSTARAVVLAGPPKAVNTVDEPRKVAPQEEVVQGVSTAFRRTFPPHSLTVLRIKQAQR